MFREGYFIDKPLGFQTIRIQSYKVTAFTVRCINSKFLPAGMYTIAPQGRIDLFCPFPQHFSG
jgi:hypothetical protein